MIDEKIIRLDRKVDLGAGTHTDGDWITMDVSAVFKPDFQGDLLRLPMKCRPSQKSRPKKSPHLRN